MENDTNTPATQLHDLIQILTERVEVYRAIISSADANKDINLIAFLEKCMQLTQQFKSELNGVLAKEDSPFSERDWMAGNLYTHWQDQKPSAETIRRDEVMEVCEKTENTLLRIFQEILSNTNSLTESTTAMLKSQATLQQEIVEQIKSATKEA